jgi:hypothetical protein
MRKSTLVLSLAVILLSALIASVHATPVTVETSITQNFRVVYTFSDINKTMYENIKGNMTKDTVPIALYNSMVKKGLSKVDYNSQSISFNGTTYAIVSAFNLQGSSIINSTIDRSAKIETFRINTVWREFFLNVTTDFYFNFTRDFGESLSYWANSTTGGVRSYSYSNSTTGASFSFLLPRNASNIVVNGDTITFETPYESSFEDNLINSPILILIALAVAGVIIYFYRKIR